MWRKATAHTTSQGTLGLSQQLCFSIIAITTIETIAAITMTQGGYCWLVHLKTQQSGNTLICHCDETCSNFYIAVRGLFGYMSHCRHDLHSAVAYPIVKLAAIRSALQSVANIRSLLSVLFTNTDIVADTSCYTSRNTAL